MTKEPRSRAHIQNAASVKSWKVEGPSVYALLNHLRKEIVDSCNNQIEAMHTESELYKHVILRWSPGGSRSISVYIDAKGKQNIRQKMHVPIIVLRVSDHKNPRKNDHTETLRVDDVIKMVNHDGSAERWSIYASDKKKRNGIDWNVKGKEFFIAISDTQNKIHIGINMIMEKVNRFVRDNDPKM